MIYPLQRHYEPNGDWGVWWKIMQHADNNNQNSIWIGAHRMTDETLLNHPAHGRYNIPAGWVFV